MGTDCRVCFLANGIFSEMKSEDETGNLMQPETQTTQHDTTRNAHQGAARGRRRRP
jgi:hypothetical protein